MNKEDIIKEIKELKKRKVDLSYTNMRTNHRVLYREGGEKFGSWKKAVKSISFINLIHPTMKGMIIGLIIGVIGILLFIFFDSLKNPLFITVYIGVFIVGSITFLKIKDPVNKITNILFAFFMFMAFFVTNKTYELTLEANKPQLTTQLTTNDLPWGHFVENYEYTVWYNKLNDSSFNLPIHLIINNYGSVPTQIYNIQFKTLCGNNAGLLSIPQNQSSLIKPGEFFELSDDIYINVENGTIKEILPCKVNFWIGGPNFDMVHKTITLVEDKQ